MLLPFALLLIEIVYINNLTSEDGDDPFVSFLRIGFILSFMDSHYPIDAYCIRKNCYLSRQQVDLHVCL